MYLFGFWFLVMSEIVIVRFLFIYVTKKNVLPKEHELHTTQIVFMTFADVKDVKADLNWPTGYFPRTYDWLKIIIHIVKGCQQLLHCNQIL